MTSNQAEVWIPLQVGSEVHIKNNGEIRVDNSELELAKQQARLMRFSHIASIQNLASTSYACLIRLPTTGISDSTAGAIRFPLQEFRSLVTIVMARRADLASKHPKDENKIANCNGHAQTPP